MKKRMILALVLVIALLCMACANDADDGADGAEGVSVAETGGAETSTDASAESSSRTDSTSSTDGTSGETSTESSTAGTDGTDMNTSSVGTGSMGTDTSGVGTGGTSSNDTSSSDTSNASSNANGSTSNDTSNASSNANGSTSTGTESSGTGSGTSTSSKPAENSESSDTSSSSGNPSQTAHKHSYKTTVVKPTCTEDGYTLHKCSCGDSYKDNEVPATGHEFGPYSPIRAIKKSTYTEPGIHERVCMHCQEWVLDEKFDEYWEPPVNDEEEAYRRIIALKEDYPHGSVWDGYSKYDAPWDSYHRGYGSGYACNGFAQMVSNAAFGTYWGEIKTLEKGSYTMKDIRVGDLIYFEGHVVVALEVHDDYIITVDGNNCGDVCWGDENGLLSAIFPDYFESSCYIETRYDPEYF